MANGSEARRDWRFVTQHMPRVAPLMKARRDQDGDAHVDECWRRGVLCGERGWFFAREGAVAVGVPDPSWLVWPELKDVPGADLVPQLWLRDKPPAEAVEPQP